MKTTRIGAWPVIALLLTSGLVLLFAFAKAPALLLSGRYASLSEPTALETAVAEALGEFWRSGSASPPQMLTDLVGYWFLWHAIKVTICVLMLAVAVLLSRALWSRYLVSVRRNAWLYNAAAVGLIFPAFGVGVVLVANVQSTLVPLVSLLQVLPGTDAGAEVRAEIVAAMANHAGAASSATLLTLLAEVTRYHWALAGACLAMAVLVGAISAISRGKQRNSETGSRSRTMWTTVLIATLVVTILFIGLSAFGVISALDSEAALLDVL